MSNWVTIRGHHIDLDDPDNPVTGSGKWSDFGRNETKGVKGLDYKPTVSEQKRIAELKDEASHTSIFGGKRLAVIRKYEAIENGFGDDVESYLKWKEEKIAEQNAKFRATKETRQSREQKNDHQESYMMEHRPTESGITADDITNQNVESPMPKDLYEHPERYFSGDPKFVKESMEALKAVRGNPNATITIYRATVGDSINDGDWITLSKSYADEHNGHSLKGKGKIISMKVPVKDIQFAGDDINEWGYFPKKKK